MTKVQAKAMLIGRSELMGSSEGKAVVDGVVGEVNSGSFVTVEGSCDVVGGISVPGVSPVTGGVFTAVVESGSVGGIGGGVSSPVVVSGGGSSGTVVGQNSVVVVGQNSVVVVTTGASPQSSSLWLNLI